MDESMLFEKKISGEEIFSGVILHVVKDKVELPNGKTSSRELIRHNGAVGVVAMTEDGRVCIERQYRYPIDLVITEIPAGKLDTPDEDRLSAAKRELREETGLTADSWDFLGTCYSAGAYTDEKITLYLARGLHQGEQQLDEGEFLNVGYKPLDELIEDIMNDKIPDGKTQIALLKTAEFLKRKQM